MLFPSYDGLFLLVLLSVFATLMALASALMRQDLYPVTRLTWVIVVIFVPFFGSLYYFSLSRYFHNQLSGTPWENDPRYTVQKKRKRRGLWPTWQR